MIMPLAIADCVHIYLTFSKAREQGKARVEAITLSMQQNLKPVALTSFTTALGF
jgi:predicted RND superfamily exporter protein